MEFSRGIYWGLLSPSHSSLSGRRGRSHRVSRGNFPIQRQWGWGEEAVTPEKPLLRPSDTMFVPLSPTLSPRFADGERE
jgi:hypothetical protein